MSEVINYIIQAGDPINTYYRKEELRLIGALAHDSEDCERDEERVTCEECGACLCEDGDHYRNCSDYVHSSPYEDY